jgi:hypothetical protein
MSNIEKELKQYGFDIEKLKKELGIKEEKKKRLYSIYVKSHTELPDYEDEVEAENCVEAVKIFQSKSLRDWGLVDILREMDFPLNDLDDVDRVVLALLDELRYYEERFYEARVELGRLKEDIERTLRK